MLGRLGRWEGTNWSANGGQLVEILRPGRASRRGQLVGGCRRSNLALTRALSISQSWTVDRAEQCPKHPRPVDSLPQRTIVRSGTRDGGFTPTEEDPVARGTARQWRARLRLSTSEAHPNRVTDGCVETPVARKARETAPTLQKTTNLGLVDWSGPTGSADGPGRGWGTNWSGAFEAWGSTGPHQGHLSRLRVNPRRGVNWSARHPILSVKANWSATGLRLVPPVHPPGSTGRDLPSPSGPTGRAHLQCSREPGDPTTLPLST